MCLEHVSARYEWERQSCGGLLLEILLQDISHCTTLRSEVPMGGFLSSPRKRPVSARPDARV